MKLPLDSELRHRVVEKLKQAGGKVDIPPGMHVGDIGVVARRLSNPPRITVNRRERISNGGAINVSDTTFGPQGDEPGTFSDILGRNLTPAKAQQEANDSLRRVVE